jgi:two-component system phosphate regulon sensor histidine kinase PhoR
LATTPITSSRFEGSATSSRSDVPAAASLPAWSGTLRSPILWKSYVLTLGLVVLAVVLGHWIGPVAGIAAAIGLGLVLVYWNTRSLIVPLAEVLRAARSVAQASHATPIPTADVDEESISRLGAALNSISGDLAERFRQLADERHRLEAVIAATLEGVVALDEDGRVTLANQAAQRLLTMGPRECLGRMFAEVSRVPRLAILADEAVAANELRTDELRQDGQTLQVYATPLGSRAGVALVIHDLTEMRRLESVRRDFVANVSHELKTPLTSIRGYVETLLEGGLEDTENNLRFLKKIDVHVNRLAALITDLLSLSRIESGEAFNQRLRLNLTDVLLGAYQRLAPDAQEKALDMRVDAGSEPIYILGDLEALRQILDNLIDNAIKYNKPGGLVELGIARDGARARITVRDTGVGISREDLPRIFERFYRVDKARSREVGGTGLGLSIVKHLVQALDGEIQVQSEEGVGATFTVWFPEIQRDESGKLANN